MSKEQMARVICANCGWRGRRKTGNIVLCPNCGNCATFAGTLAEAKQPTNEERKP